MEYITNCDVETRFLRRIEQAQTDDGCWIWPGAKSVGEGKGAYGLFTIKWKSGGRQTFLAHVFSYWIHFGGTGGLCVLHHCDNPSCVRPDHLFLGTRKDNSADAIQKGRIKGGPNSPARNRRKAA
jgi:hypothetical protein